MSPHPDPTDAESPGNFRRHNVHPFGEAMTPPSWPLVPAALDEWVAAITAIPALLRDGGNLPELMAEAHNHFERVHPFIDGNGRTGRLAQNLVLVRLGYPPAVILKEQRATYLRAMQQADQDDPGPLGEILARAMIDNLNRFIIPNVAGPAKLIPLAGAHRRRPQPRRPPSRRPTRTPRRPPTRRRTMAQHPQSRHHLQGITT